MKYWLQSAAVMLLLAWGATGCGHITPSPAPTDQTSPAATNAAAPAVTNAAAPAAPGEPAPEPMEQVATNAISEPIEDAYRQIHLLTKAIMLIRRNYVDDANISYKDLVYSALNGMLTSLDPYSQFLEPTGYQDLRDDTQGEFGGIGIVIGVKDGVLTVIAPMEDTPAFRAGLLAGDKIIGINGDKTDGLSLRDAIKKLRGEKGSAVLLKILRNREVKEYSLVRDVIKVASVKGARLLDDGIGYIRITQFNEPTAESLREAVEKLRQQGLKALVLDLRNNPGGLLSSAVAVSEIFLEPGSLIVFTKGRGDVQNQPPFRAAGRYHCTDFPMAILVNGGTASASEIVAGALQDNKRAMLVGETTFGKGSVQTIIQVEDGTALRLTTAKYYTPSKRVIHEKGIEPDVAVPVTVEELQAVISKRNVTENPELYADKEKPANLDQIVDRQLERAVDLLKGILIFRSRE